MFPKASTLLLALVAIAAAAPRSGSGIAPSASLIDFMMQSETLRTANTLNMNCFDWYLPILKEYSDQYEADYKACKEQYDVAKWLADTTYGIARNGIDAKAKEICGALERCAYEVDTSTAFDCYSKTAPVQSAVLTTIGNNATDLNNQLLRELTIIDLNLNSCQTKAERVYKEGSDASFDELNACLSDPNWSPPNATLSS